MHELALAQAVLDVVAEHAGERPVERVEVRVGALRQVVPESLAFCFEAVARGTVAEGAELAIEHVPARISCRCGADAELEAFPLACPACGSLEVSLTGGEEFLVESLEVLDGPVAGRR